MCHSRSTDKLARFAARPFPDRFLRQLTDISAAPEDHNILRAANAPLIPGNERYYHLDGSRDDSREIAFLAGDGRRSHLLGVPLVLADPETQHGIVSVSLLRRRIWLNGGRGEGQDEDFRFVVDGRGTWIVRLRSGDTPPDSAVCSTIDEEEDEVEEDGEDEYTNLLDIPDMSPWDFQSSQFGPFQLTARQRRNQRVANTRLSDISTRLNVLHGIPHASTRLPSPFLRTLSDIQNLANEFRGLPRHLISERTFAMFDSVLDQLERTASVETIASRRGGNMGDIQIEPDQPTHQFTPTNSASTSSSEEHSASPPPSPVPASTPLTILTLRHTPPHLPRDRLRSIIASLQAMLASPNLPARQTFSSVRRAFDEIPTLLEETSDEPPGAELLDLVGIAQGLFWMLARRAFPGAYSAGAPTRAGSVSTARGRSRARARSESEARPVPAVRVARRRRAARRTI